ncbi:tyrosine-type recombinase/integrase [Acutalibacter muris]|uniref:tyrosine-type recombinase/integrase n=1 Tax=Acutalibacter muris TaxID=1796620 RepID=UPI00214F7E3A|nr:tyrosine-type recombinase/integrase [Acutalibacter muris]
MLGQICASLLQHPYSTVTLHKRILKSAGLSYINSHALRHTFGTRMCEAGVNVKVIQDTLGHKDISTTLNIYIDVTKELKRSEFEGLDLYFKNE